MKNTEATNGIAQDKKLVHATVNFIESVLFVLRTRDSDGSRRRGAKYYMILRDSAMVDPARRRQHHMLTG